MRNCEILTWHIVICHSVIIFVSCYILISWSSLISLANLPMTRKLKKIWQVISYIHVDNLLCMSLQTPLFSSIAQFVLYNLLRAVHWITCGRSNWRLSHRSLSIISVCIECSIECSISKKIVSFPDAGLHGANKYSSFFVFKMLMFRGSYTYV